MSDRLAKVINIRDAQIKTMAVEIKSMTVSNRQVTLALFRQLVEEDLISYDGTLKGLPWGTVNYCPDKRCSHERHWHVVWQKGSELRRATVLQKPPNVAADFEHEAVDNYLNATFRDVILGRRSDDGLPFVLDTDKVIHQFKYRELTLQAWSIDSRIKDLQRTLKRPKRCGQEAEDSYCCPDDPEPDYDEDGYSSRKACWYECARHERAECAAAMDADFGSQIDSEKQFNRAIDDELARRARWRKTLNEITTLPQLFIAV
jgi:hypothetical protein